jgi:hypothetical protein
MERSVSIYAITKIDVPHVAGATEADVLANAVASADLRGFHSIARYELDGGGVYHDRKHLETIHEDRMNYALPFDLEEHIDDTVAHYLRRNNLLGSICIFLCLVMATAAVGPRAHHKMHVRRHTRAAATISGVEPFRRRQTVPPAEELPEAQLQTAA